MNNKLRIGILVDSDQIPNWTFKMLERVHASNYAEFVLIVKNDTPTPSKKSVYRKVRDNFGRLIYLVLTRIDDAIFKSEPNAFEPKHIHQLLPNTPSITVKPIQKSFSDYFREDDIKTIKSHHIDVLIRLGVRILRGEVLTCARYGVWSYHHGDNRINRGGPVGFWEVLDGCGETGSILQILSEDLDSGQILYRSHSQTDHLSVRRNKNNYYWKTLSFLPRKLKELYELGGEEFLSRVRQDNQHPFFYSRRIFTEPKHAELIGLTLRHYSKYIWRKLQSLFYFDQWILLYDANHMAECSSSLWRFKEIVPPKDRFWADPFIIYDNHKYYVFIEEFLYKKNKGHISYLTIDENGNTSVPKKIIEKPYHLSYPFVFSHNNEYYMIPETADNRTIELYKCVQFPEKWELATTLMKDIYAVDPTVFLKDGKWWLFVNVCENEGASPLDELFLFYSADLFCGNWTPHPKNPVVSDVKSARPAGRIFSFNGNVYRPSQNNSWRYGYGMKLNQIVALSETEYKEVCVNDIEPQWDKRMRGIHTLNCVEKLTMVDAIKRRPRYFS